MKEQCLQCQKEMSFNLPSNFCSMACEKRHAKEGKRRNVVMDTTVTRMDSILRRRGLRIKRAYREHGMFVVDLERGQKLFCGYGTDFVSALISAMEGQAQA